MFEHVTDLSYQRNWKQAVGFYLVYLLILSLSAGVIVIIYLALTGGLPVAKIKSADEGFRNGLEIAKNVVPWIVPSVSIILAGLVIRAKKLYTAVAFVCVVLSVALSVFGAIFSLIPITYMTTLPKSAPKEK